MLCTVSPNTDPYFNLASEEYLLKCKSEEVFLLYRNIPSIVVGKHQNTLAEINLPFVQERAIPVARRISGGGTVFHDLGNLNFAFITNEKEGELVNYRKATAPVIEAMRQMGLEVQLGKRNELLLNGLKISGTASHVFKHRALHHGTLLFSSEMENLASALKAARNRFSDKAVKSVRSKVTNIKGHLPESMEMEEFQTHLFEAICSGLKGAIPYEYSETDLKEIRNLTDTRFSTWEWNFGYSPKYQFTKSLSFDSGRVDLHMNVEKGVIKEMKIEGDFISEKGIRYLEELMTGSIHDPETLRMRLSRIEIAEYISGMKNEEFLSLMF